MANITWGPWEYSGGNGMRVGLEALTTKPVHESTTMTITWNVWTQNQYAYSGDSQTLTYGGVLSGTTTFTNTNGTAASMRATKTSVYTYPAGSYGSVPSYQQATVALSGAVNGVTPAASLTIPVTPRPYGLPDAPTNVSVTHNTDSNIVVSFDLKASAAKPVTTRTIYRSYDNGAWQIVASLSGSFTANATQTWTDTTASPNHGVRYKVRASNSAGSSADALTGNTVFTTAPAPINVQASRRTSGITVTWENPGVRFDVIPKVYRSVAGGSYVGVAESLALGTQSWTDTSPGVGTNQYRVRYEYSFNNGPTNATKYSLYAYSNVSTIAVVPLAPILLRPTSGQNVDAARPVLFEWNHADAGDASEQSGYQFRYSSNGGGTWTTTGPIASEDEFVELAAGTLVNNATYIWQVSTKGLHADYGPWSATRTLYTRGTPTVAPIVTPGAVLTTMPLVVSWTYGQSEGLPQASYNIRLLDEVGNVLGQWSRSGTDQMFEVPSSIVLSSGQTYVVEVTVTSSTGQVSDTVSHSFDVDLMPPAEVTLDATFDCDFGTVTLNMTVAEPVEGATATVDFLDLQRRVLPDGDWTTFMAGLATNPNIVVLDTTAPVTGSMEYRALVSSTNMSAAYTAPVTVEVPRDCAVAFLSWGPGFGKVVRAACDPVVSESTDRSRESRPVIGREVPMLLVGTQRARVVNVSLALAWGTYCRPGDVSSRPDEFLEAGSDAEIALYRDFYGRRIFGKLSPVAVQWTSMSTANVSFSIEQTSYTDEVEPLTDLRRVLVETGEV